MRKLRFVLLAALGTMAASIAAAQEAPTQVAVVHIVDGRNATEPYPALHDKYTAIWKKSGAQVERELWGAGFAGPDTGRWVVVIKFPSIEAFAKSNAVVDSAEYQALNAELTQKGFRVESSSLQFRAR